MNTAVRKTLAWLLTLVLALPTTALGEAGKTSQPFKPEELEQLVAPIALYPDSLVAQVFMASTYPLEVVQAARWVKENPKVTGAQLEEALQKQPWDPSVKSLTTVPQVLTMMNEKLDWTQKLGDAFLAQQKELMDAVQRLRAKAQAQGNLQSTKEQKIVVEQAPAQTTTIIKIEQANPQVVYVPTYNPTVVYGVWPYPAYPPYYYYPPGYVAGAAMFSFAVGVAVGSAMWGNCNWGHGDVNVNVNKYNNLNKTNINNSNWQHKPEHRKGAQYRDQATQQRFGKAAQPGAQTRESFRGRAEQGQRELAQGGAQQLREGPGQRGSGAGERAGQSGRPSGGPGDGLGRTREAGAFSGVGNGPQVRSQSDRGFASRSGGGGHPGGLSGGGGGGRGGGGGGGRRR